MRSILDGIPLDHVSSLFSYEVLGVKATGVGASWRVKITRFLVLKTVAHSSVLFSPPQSSKALISPELTLRIAECFSAVPTYDQFIATPSPCRNLVPRRNYLYRAISAVIFWVPRGRAGVL